MCAQSAFPSFTVAPSPRLARDYPNIRQPEARPDDLKAIPAATLGRGLFMLAAIRFLERWLLDHVELVHGPLHSSIGQEAVAVGIALALRDPDTITATHRAHHEVVARQIAHYAPIDFNPLTADAVPDAVCSAIRGTLAEILGLADGLGGGRGGSMHLADPGAGIVTSAIVGGGIPIAAGQGLAAKLRATGGVALTAFGDGSVSIGAFHEAASLARALGLPVIFLVENNLYSVATTVVETAGFSDLAIRASGYDMPALIVDGMDPVAVAMAVAGAREHAVSLGQPVLIEARTYRYYHQNGPLPGSAFRYRTKDEEREWAARDPFAVFPSRLVESGLLTLGEVDHAVSLARALVDDSVANLTIETPGGRYVDPGSFPSVETVCEGMRGPGVPTQSVWAPGMSPQGGGEEITYAAAISQVVANALRRDPEAFVMGEEVGHLGGGVFGATKAALAAFPDRVISTPICENGFAGAALGAALQGMHPIIELMYPDFALEAADQLFNHVAKARYMYGGHGPVPIVVRTQVARGRGYGPQHSCDPAALFALFPGWRITAPSTADEYVGLFNAAMLTRDPVLVIDDHRLSKATSSLPPAGLDYVIAPGSARLVRAGSDVTVLAWGHALTRVTAIADQLAESAISVEIVDPRWLDRASFPRGDVLRSAARTGALVLVEEAPRTFSMGAMILDYLSPDLYEALQDAPVRVTGEDVYLPVSKPLETQALLRDEEIAAAVVIAVQARRPRLA
jgi:2-oxoisovalerate dehydrogenase E1 component